MRAFLKVTVAAATIGLCVIGLRSPGAGSAREPGGAAEFHAAHATGAGRLPLCRRRVIFPPAHPACSMPATTGQPAADIAAVGPAAIIPPVRSATTMPARRTPADTGTAIVGKSVAEGSSRHHADGSPEFISRLSAP